VIRAHRRSAQPHCAHGSMKSSGGQAARRHERINMEATVPYHAQHASPSREEDSAGRGSPTGDEESSYRMPAARVVWRRRRHVRCPVEFLPWYRMEERRLAHQPQALINRRSASLPWSRCFSGDSGEGRETVIAAAAFRMLPSSAAPASKATETRLSVYANMSTQHGTVRRPFRRRDGQRIGTECFKRMTERRNLRLASHALPARPTAMPIFQQQCGGYRR